MQLYEDPAPLGTIILMLICFVLYPNYIICDNNHQMIKPQQKICGKVPYNPTKKICCSDTLQEGNERDFNTLCCGNVKYNRSTELCCEQKLVIKQNFTHIKQCCKGAKLGYFDTTTHTCCDDVVYEGAHRSCCGNQAINNKTHKCCGDHPITKEQSCCNGIALKNDEICCGKYGPKKKTIYTDQCCQTKDGGVLYNKKYEICFMGKLYQNGPDMQRCENTGLYNKTSQLCCQGRIHNNFDGEFSCCLEGYDVYFSKNQSCCNDKIVEGPGKSDEICHKELCGEIPYNPEGFTCCIHGGKYSLHPESRRNCCGTDVESSGYLCCNNTLYDSSQAHCKEGKVVQKRPVPTDHPCTGLSTPNLNTAGKMSTVFKMTVGQYYRGWRNVTVNKIYQHENIAKPKENKQTEVIQIKIRARNWKVKQGKQYFVILNRLKLKKRLKLRRKHTIIIKASRLRKCCRSRSRKRSFPLCQRI